MLFFLCLDSTSVSRGIFPFNRIARIERHPVKTILVRSVVRGLGLDTTGCRFCFMRTPNNYSSLSMSTLFGLIAFASFVCLFIGLFKLDVFKRLSKKPMTRKRVLVIFGSVFFIAFVLSAASSPTQPTTGDQAADDSVPTETATYTTDEGTPEREIEKSVIALLKEKTNEGEQRVRNIDMVPSDSSGETSTVLIEYAADSNLTSGMTRRGIWSDTIEIVKELSTDGSIDSVTVNAYLALVDQYGNEAPGKVMMVNLTKPTWSKINWDNFITYNLQNVADLYWVHPAISD